MNYNRNMKEFKEWDLAKSIVYYFAISLLLVLVVCVILIKSMNMRLDKVLSDSMAPVFKKGDIIVIKPQDSYKVNDIVEFKKNEVGAYVTHRIVEYYAPGVALIREVDGASVSYRLPLAEETANYTSVGIYGMKGEFEGAQVGDYITKDKIVGKEIAIWRNGEYVYNTISNNYLLILSMVFGLWVVSYTITSEGEIKKHNIIQA